MPIPRALLGALSLALSPWLASCRTAPPEPTPPLQQLQQSAAAGSTQQQAAPEPVALGASTSTVPVDDSNLLLGNPSNARSDAPDNLLIERPQHSMSYNAGKGEPNWVAWHVGKSDLGRVGRGTFRPDPLLPAAYQIRPNDYRGSGYDRGHVCPSADRTSSRENNDATFVMSNMLPQAPALNQQVWAKLETYARSLVRRGNELYVMAGGEGSLGRIGGGKINVPAWCWKIIVVLPEGTGDLQRINADTRVITVLMPNQDTPEVGGARWSKYLTNARAVEGALGYRFFSVLPPGVQQALKAKTDSGRAGADEAADEAGLSARSFPTPESIEVPGRSIEARPGSETLGTAPYSPPAISDGQAQSAPALEQQREQPATNGQVWVNTRSGIFHYPGTRWYGNTSAGEYMSESEALNRGYRAARNGQ